MDGKFGYYVDNNGNLKKDPANKRIWKITNPDTDNKHVTEVWADIRDSENSIIETMYIDQAVKAVQAVNCHDELVEALKGLISYLEENYDHNELIMNKCDIYKQALSKAESEK